MHYSKNGRERRIPTKVKHHKLACTGKRCRVPGGSETRASSNRRIVWSKFLGRHGFRALVMLPVNLHDPDVQPFGPSVFHHSKATKRKRKGKGVGEAPHEAMRQGNIARKRTSRVISETDLLTHIQWLTGFSSPHFDRHHFRPRILHELAQERPKRHVDSSSEIVKASVHHYDDGV